MIETTTARKNKNSDSVISNNNTSIIYGVPVSPARANAIDSARSDSSRRLWCWRDLTIAWRFTSALLRMCGSFIREPSLASEAPAGKQLRGGGVMEEQDGGERRLAARSGTARGEPGCRFQFINIRGPKSPTSIIEIVWKTFLSKKVEESTDFS